MTNEELNTALYKKVFAEREKYREWLLSQPPNEILNHCYEYTVREDIVLALEEYDLSDKQCKALLKSPNPLADVFRDFEKRETDHMDYGLIICQANGRPIMTEHLNKRFKEVLIGLNDPTINVDNVVFHSLRHTSTGVKLRLSKGDLKAVQGDGGWNSPDMVTKRYAHILDEDRRRLADEMEQSFYKGKAEEAPVAAAPALDAEALASLLASNPELLKKALESVQLANNT